MKETAGELTVNCSGEAKNSCYETLRLMVLNKEVWKGYSGIEAHAT